MELRAADLELAARLRRSRVSSGWTQRDLALKLGKPQSFISKIETCERKPGFLEVLQIADRLGIKIESLIPSNLRKRSIDGNR